MADRDRKTETEPEIESKPEILTQRLDRLRVDLNASRKLSTDEQSDRPEVGKAGSADYSRALRLSTEFVAAILVGAGLGWGLDRVAGTKPWGMIILLMLGFVAGVLNVLRSAQAMTDPED